MSKYFIQGGFPLCGEVTIQGAKNAAQKILPTTIVFPGTYVLHNLPRIQDTAALIEILRFLGAEVTFPAPHTERVNTERVITKEIPPEITALSTGTFLFAGALLSRYGEVKLWHPGGDRIGKRPVTWHLDAFRRLGASIQEVDAYIRCAQASWRERQSLSSDPPPMGPSMRSLRPRARLASRSLRTSRQSRKFAMPSPFCTPSERRLNGEERAA